MGPHVLFDKSFLEMLSKDEAIFFDCLFSSIICPVFYAEALADLSKSEGRATPEKLVQDIADKTPVMHSYPTAHHLTLIELELCGREIEMREVPHLPRGKFTRDADGRISAIYSESQEAQAFSRWQRQRFQEVERNFASVWRSALRRAENGKLASLAKAAFSIMDSPRSLENAYHIADAIVGAEEQAEKNIVLGCKILGLSNEIASQALHIWKLRGGPKLAKCFPYFSHCLKVELFFHVAVEKTLISPERASNKIDITYLFYLPFCKFFTSNDKLHKRSASLFMKGSQSFVDGPALKMDLKNVCDHFSNRIEEIESEGLFRIAKEPPLGPESLCTKMWKAARFDVRSEPYAMAPSRPASDLKVEAKRKPFKARRELADEIKARIDSMKTGKPIDANLDLSSRDVQQVAIERLIPMRKGRWRLIPESFRPSRR